MEGALTLFTELISFFAQKTVFQKNQEIILLNDSALNTAPPYAFWLWLLHWRKAEVPLTVEKQIQILFSLAKHH